MTPIGLDVGQTDGQLSLIDPFIVDRADKEYGPRRSEEDSGAIVMMEPKDSSKRAASRPPNKDGDSPYAKRQRSLIDAEVDELFGGSTGGVAIGGSSESDSMAESIEKVMNALINESKAEDLTLKELYQQASMPASGSISMMDALADMNQNFAALQDRHAVVVHKNQEMSSELNRLLTANQKLMVQGGAAQVLSEKNQQISNQERYILDLQQYYGFMLNQAEDHVRAISARDLLLRERHTTIQALQRRVEELEWFVEHYPACLKNNNALIQKQEQKIQELEQENLEFSGVTINNTMLKGELFHYGRRIMDLKAENRRLIAENVKLGGQSDHV